MTIQELIENLEKIQNLDPEKAHRIADDLLIQFINNKEVTQAYDKIEKWYA